MATIISKIYSLFKFSEFNSSSKIKFLGNSNYKEYKKRELIYF